MSYARNFVPHIPNHLWHDAVLRAEVQREQMMNNALIAATIRAEEERIRSRVFGRRRGMGFRPRSAQELAYLAAEERALRQSEHRYFEALRVRAGHKNQYWVRRRYAARFQR